MTAKSFYDGFPMALLGLLRCPVDSSGLTPENVLESASGYVKQGSLNCQTCRRAFPIVNGIVKMLTVDQLDEEELHENQERDRHAGAITKLEQVAYEQGPESQLEVPQHIAALRLSSQSVLLELGCGHGRFTLPFQKTCQAILAVDFSLSSLEFLASRLPPGGGVGLVHSSITRLELAPQSFDRAFSTTSLDTREQRLKMHHVVSVALKDSGHYVFSTEHFCLRSRLFGHPRVASYGIGTSLFRRLTRAEVEREAAPYFMSVRSRPIMIHLPFSFRLTLLSRVAEHIPFVRELGFLLLVSASRPIRELQKGQAGKGNRMFLYLYRRFRKPRKQD